MKEQERYLYPWFMLDVLADEIDVLRHSLPHITGSASSALTGKSKQEDEKGKS